MTQVFETIHLRICAHITQLNIIFEKHMGQIYCIYHVLSIPYIHTPSIIIYQGEYPTCHQIYVC